MSRLVIDHDPLSGETVYFDYEENTGRTVITQEQDVSRQLVMAHEMSVDGEYTKNGIKRDWWHYAHVPNGIIIEMKQKYGVDFFDDNDWPRVLKLLNTEYKAFKATDKHHA